MTDTVVCINMMTITQKVILLLFIVPYVAYAYKPVIFMHGILSNAPEANQLFTWIKQDHPGTETLSIDMYNNLNSLVNMMEQVEEVGATMMKYMQQYPDGVNLICFSQDTVFMKFVFPTLLRDSIYRVAYSREGQNISVGNYWNDPHHQDLYKDNSKFLAVLNNDTYNPNSKEYKSNFLRLKKLVMIGGPDDGVITPWQSSHFGFYNDKLDVVETKNQTWYTGDPFGLQSLDKRGGMFIREIPGVQHTHWHSTYSVYKDHILPFLT